MIEALTNPLSAEKRPKQMFLLGLLYSSIGLGLAAFLFKGYASLVMVFFTVFASVPIIYNTIRLEEKKDEDYKTTERGLIREHAKALKVFMYLFVGIMVSWSLWYVVISYVSPDSLFDIYEAQLTTLRNINSVTGKSIYLENKGAAGAVLPMGIAAVIGNGAALEEDAAGLTGNVAGITGESARVTSAAQLEGGTELTSGFSQMDYFTRIFANNVKVLMFCILFSFIYGLGAIFILTWNASVIATAIGDYLSTKFHAVTSTGFGAAGDYFHISACGFVLKYSIHGLMEILAYFIAGLAGGIISIAVIRHTMGTKKFQTVVVDSADLVIIAVIVLFLSSVVEAFITPNIVSAMLCH